MRTLLRRLLITLTILIVALGGPWLAWRQWWSGEMLYRSYNRSIRATPVGAPFLSHQLLVMLDADLHWRAHHGDTVLHLAVNASDPKAVLLFLNAGANPNAKDKNGLAPLHDALTRNRYESVLHLIQAGADPNAPGTHGIQPLHRALDMLDSEERYIELLLKAGADPNVKGPISGETPLNSIINSNVFIDHPERAQRAAKLLIRYGADIDAKHPEGYTPLESWPALADIAAEVEAEKANR